MKKRAEVGGAMMRGEGSHGGLRRGKKRRGPGSEKSIFAQHKVVIPESC